MDKIEVQLLLLIFIKMELLIVIILSCDQQIPKNFSLSVCNKNNVAPTSVYWNSYKSILITKKLIKQRTGNLYKILMTSNDEKVKVETRRKDANKKEMDLYSRKI